MYQKINTISNTIAEAEEFIVQNDRHLYSDIMRITEQFCRDNNFLIDSRNLLCNGRDVITRDDFNYHIYYSGGFKKATELAILILGAKAPHIDINTTALKTVVKNREFAIMVNMRTIISLTNTNINFDNIKQLSNGYFVNNIYIVNHLFHLINTYRNLSDFSQYKKWVSEMEIEDKLYDLLIVANSQTINKHSFYVKDNQKLLKILMSLDVVIIGDYACEIAHGRAQIISCIPLEIILTKLKKEYKKITTTESQFPFDLRLKKYTIKVDGKDILDIFNLAEYEAIPFNMKDGIKIGNPFILMRFALIQYFILTNMGISPDIPLINYLKFRTIYKEIMLKPDEITNQLYNKENLYGHNISEKITIKEIMKDDKFSIYFPAIAIRTHREGGNDSIIPKCRKGSSVHWSTSTDLKIVQKITKDYRKSIVDILKSFYQSTPIQWTQKPNKNNTRYDDILSKITPHNKMTYIDIGTGDGNDFALIGEKVSAQRKIAVDVGDFRLDKSSELLIIEPNQPINLPDNSVQFVTFLHSLHHCEDAIFRLKDITRLLSPGGYIMIKDHDVTNDEEANNVSLEHFVYSVGEGKAEHFDNKRYQEIEPMWYYSAHDIRNYITSLGFTERHFIEYRNPTKIYYVLFEKNKNTKSGGGHTYQGTIYKGDFTFSDLI